MKPKFEKTSFRYLDKGSFLLAANSKTDINIVMLKKDVSLQPITHQIGKFYFEVGKRFTMIGNRRLTSAGYTCMECLAGYEHEYAGSIEDWLCFATFYKGEKVPPIALKADLFSAQGECYWAAKLFDENALFTINYSESGRIILMD